MKVKPLKVSEVNNYIRKIFYSNPILNNVSVIGEVKDLRHSKNGYQYFSLKEDHSMIHCVCFQPDLEIPEDKIAVIKGRVETYDKRSVYQLIVQEAEIMSEGLESQYLKELMAKLEKKGYFALDQKKKLPAYPSKIGVITSMEGAVIADIKRVFDECQVGLDVYFYNAYVQGRSAVFNMVAGLKYFNEVLPCDVIVLARGGGSKVDLEAFNDEVLADTIFQSRVPVVTGVGHGTDLSIADLTADREVQTPTAAAELLTRHYHLAIRNLPHIKDHLIQKYQQISLQKFYYVNLLKDRLIRWDYAYYLSRKQHHLSKKISDISNESAQYIFQRQKSLNARKKQLDEHDYKGILSKGFFLARNQLGELITDLKSVSTGETLSIEDRAHFVKVTITEKGEK